MGFAACRVVVGVWVVGEGFEGFGGLAGGCVSDVEGLPGVDGGFYFGVGVAVELVVSFEGAVEAAGGGGVEPFDEGVGLPWLVRRTDLPPGSRASPSTVRSGLMTDTPDDPASGG